MDFSQVDTCVKITKEKDDESRRIRQNVSTIQIPEGQNVKAKKEFVNPKILQQAMREEEQRLLLSIKNLKKSIKKRMINVKNLKQENEHKLREYEVEKEVLRDTIELYEKCFKLNVEIEKNSEKTYSAIIDLQINESTFPIKVIIDKENRVLTDFDATSIISKEDMDEIKDKYIGKDCGLSSLMSYLRELKLSQV